MSSRSVGLLSLLSWLLDRVLAFVFAYIMLKGVRKITRHQESDQLAVDPGRSQPNRTLVQVGIVRIRQITASKPNYFGSSVCFSKLAIFS
jgi:hypothetical protein